VSWNSKSRISTLSKPLPTSPLGHRGTSDGVRPGTIVMAEEREEIIVWTPTVALGSGPRVELECQGRLGGPFLCMLIHIHTYINE
jgi:hypothetical protein